MPDWPDQAIDDAGPLGGHEPRCRVLVWFRHPCGAKQNVQGREKGGKVLVAMLQQHGMMYPMPLRVVDPCHEPSKRHPDIEMRTRVGDEEDKSHGHRHVRRDTKQDR